MQCCRPKVLTVSFSGAISPLSWPLKAQSSKLATRNSQLATRNSQLATRNSQLELDANKPDWRRVSRCARHSGIVCRLALLGGRKLDPSSSLSLLSLSLPLPLALKLKLKLDNEN